MKNTRSSHTIPTLAIMAMLGAGLLPSAAQACLFYRNTVNATKLWGLPEQNTSPVQAVVPARSRVCIDEQLPGQNGEKWGRVSFYINNDIRFTARGWANLARFEAPAPAPASRPAPDSRPAPSQGAQRDAGPSSPQKDRMNKEDAMHVPASAPSPDADDDAIINTLQAQRRELEELRKRNAMLKKRLASGTAPAKPGNSSEKMTEWKKTPHMTGHDNNKKMSLPSADPAFLDQGWSLDPSRSGLGVESVLDSSLIEKHRFTKLSGSISPAGKARVTIALNAIDSGNKIRNIRLSHLLFESEKYPLATITASLDKSALTPLVRDGKQLFKLGFMLKLHGVEKKMSAKVRVTRMKDGRLGVASVAPVMVFISDFALSKGLAKLVEIAGGKSIVPAIPVRFRLVFNPDTQSRKTSSLENTGQQTDQ